MAPSLKLTYFNSKARGEPIRLALAIAGIPFEDDRFGHDEWAARKAAAPLGQVPVLTIDNKTQLPQSGAILRYVARLDPSSNLYPTDNLQASFVDAFVCATEDIFALLRPSLVEKDADKKLQLRKDLAAEEGSLTQTLRKIDNLIAKNGTGYAVGSNLTIADLMWYSIIAWFKTGVLDGIPADYVNQFANLAKVHDNVANHPRVVEWYKTH
ncbi:glutathione S-transferase [Gaertneriomyces semiglobifer]|nr:glutathione S-transferase [Gaertneriomyces semiglobifer]